MLVFIFAPFAAEKLGEKYSVEEDQREDSLLDSLTALEMNCTLARKGLTYARRAFDRLFNHFFPNIKAPETFEMLAKVFTADADPVLNYRRVATKTGVEISIALAMASGEKIDWNKVSSVRGITKDAMTAFLKAAKKYSKKMIAIVDPSSVPSSSTTHTEVQ